jgi:hypothetical protein
MDKEIKYPDPFEEPKFSRTPYDYRNMENAGEYRGVGYGDKIGSKMSESIDAMPPKKHFMKVPRDHKG